MAISGDKQRRPLTFPDVIWATLDAEAEEAKATVSEVVLRYIESGRQQEASSVAGIEQRLDRLTAVIESWKIEPKPDIPVETSQAAPDPYECYAPYQDHIRGLDEKQQIAVAKLKEDSDLMMWNHKPWVVRGTIATWRWLWRA